MTAFGDRLFKEVIKVKWGSEGGALVQCAGSSYKKRRDTRNVHTEEGPFEDTEKAAFTSQERGLRRIQTTYTAVLGF